MKAAVLKGIEDLAVEERPVPVPKGGDVLVKVAFTGICGTDLGAFRTLSLPVNTVMGHEFSGWVEAVGDRVVNCKKGDRVVVRPCSVCFECPWCREGRISLCPHHLDDTIGLKNVDGAYAEFVLVHDFQVFPLSDGTTLRQAAQFEPLAVAVHAVEESGIRRGDRVLIIGAGAIGLLILQCAGQKRPGEIVVLEKSPFRRSRAEAMKGALVVDGPEALPSLIERYPRMGFDVVIETAGKPDTVALSLSAVAKGGQVTFVGMSPEPCQIDQFHLVASGIHISASIGYFAEHWDQAMALAEQGRVELDSMVTGEYPLERIGEGFRALLNPEQDLKILIRVNSE